MRLQRQSPVEAPSQALFDCEIRHLRSTPLRNSFRYRSYLWFVDLDDLPSLRWGLRMLAGLHARDHFGDQLTGRGPISNAGSDSGSNSDPNAGAEPDAERTIRADLDAFLATHGVDLSGGRVWMLTAARVFGYVFNPLTVYWCHDSDGLLTCVVAEVHNTYGGRHGYLVRPDQRGRAEVAKDFLVSPFEPATGASYRMSLPEPAETLDLTITLHRPGAAPFVAGVRGRRRPASAGWLLRMALRYPLAPLLVSARIRRQGIGLFLRRLPLVPRSVVPRPVVPKSAVPKSAVPTPDHVKQEAVP